MRWAFVLQLGPDTQATHRHFNGWIEEVDTGRELRFKSTDELLSFLCECVNAAQARQVQAHDKDAEGI